MNNWNMWWVKNEIFLSQLNLFGFLRLCDEESINLFLEQIETNKKELSEYLSNNYLDSKEINNWVKINGIPYADYTYAKDIHLYDKEKMLEYNMTKKHPNISFEFSGIRKHFPYRSINETVFDALTGYTEKRDEVHLFHALNKLLKSTKCIYMNFPSLKKTYPSNGARHTLDIFATHNNKILYLSPLLDDWEIVEDFQYDDSLLIVTCTYERMQWKYRNHIFYRDVLLELGHLKEILEFLGIRETKRDKKREIVNEFNRCLNFRDFYTEVNGIYEIDR